jgi:hypothetical protein
MTKKETKATKFAEMAQQFFGQNVAALCARYQYRGKLVWIGPDAICLANACLVETSGVSAGERPQVEDSIGKPVIIKNDAIELLYQPNWVDAPLPSTGEFKQTKADNFVEIVRSLEGQKIAVLCARYQYRGTLSIVGDDSICLANACAVEVSGASENKQPQVEDPIGGSIIVKFDTIEIVYQPTWSQFVLPNEDGYVSTSQTR